MLITMTIGTTKWVGERKKEGKRGEREKESKRKNKVSDDKQYEECQD